MSNEALRMALEALEGIQRYGLDTLSGRSNGPADRDWQRAGVNEMTKRARLGIFALREALAEQPAPVQPAPNASALFREALAFGLAYGPEIPAHQWDEMREEKVTQLVSRLAAPQPAQSTADKSDLETVPAKGGLMPAPAITPEHLLALAQTASLELDKVIEAFKMAEQREVKDVVIDNMGDPFVVKAYVTPQPAQQEPVKLPCCGYTDASAIKWNPYNQVVQCHNCGQAYTFPPPQRTWQGLTDEEISAIVRKAAKGAANTPPPAKPAQQEPVAWLRKSDLVELRACNYMRLGADSPSIWAPNAPDEPSPNMELVAVYTSPPQRKPLPY